MSVVIIVTVEGTGANLQELVQDHLTKLEQFTGTTPCACELTGNGVARAEATEEGAVIYRSSRTYTITLAPEAPPVS